MKITSLKERSAFENVYRKGARQSNGFLMIRVIANNRAYNRVGIVIPQHAVRHAVERNRIRRCVIEAYRSCQNDLKQGYDIVFSVREKPEIDHTLFVLKVMVNLFSRMDMMNE